MCSTKHGRNIPHPNKNYWQLFTHWRNSEFMYVRKIILHTANKSLTILDRRDITWNRDARWFKSIQEYDIELKHINGAENNLADILSRNPAGLSKTQNRELSNRNIILVNKIDLEIDNSVCEDLKGLADLQRSDPRILRIRERIAAGPDKRDHQHRLEGNILFRKGKQDATIWTPMLPDYLEVPVMRYVHEALWHSSVDECTR